MKCPKCGRVAKKTKALASDLEAQWYECRFCRDSYLKDYFEASDKPRLYPDMRFIGKFKDTLIIGD